jgi:hypothetical protein
MSRQAFVRLAILVVGCILAWPGQATGKTWIIEGLWDYQEADGLWPYVYYTMTGPNYICMPYTVDQAGSPTYTPVTVHYSFSIALEEDAHNDGWGWVNGPDLTFTSPGTQYPKVWETTCFDEDCPYWMSDFLTMSTTAVALMHNTILHAPDGTTDYRTTVGIGEGAHVWTLPLGTAPSWTIVGNPVDAQWSFYQYNDYSRIQFYSPTSPGTQTVLATFGSGADAVTCSVAFGVIIPTELAFFNPQNNLPTEGTGDKRSWLIDTNFDLQFKPLNVCFAMASFVEWQPAPEADVFPWFTPTNNELDFPAGFASGPFAVNYDNALRWARDGGGDHRLFGPGDLRHLLGQPLQLPVHIVIQYGDSWLAAWADACPSEGVRHFTSTGQAWIVVNGTPSPRMGPFDIPYRW